MFTVAVLTFVLYKLGYGTAAVCYLGLNVLAMGYIYSLKQKYKRQLADALRDLSSIGKNQ